MLSFSLTRPGTLWQWHARRFLSERTYPYQITGIRAARARRDFEAKVRTRVFEEDVIQSTEEELENGNKHTWLNEDELKNEFRMITCLDPRYLKSSDFVTISHMRHPSISFIPKTTYVWIRYYKHKTFQPFPPDTRGFFYYSAPKPGYPPMAGGLRFRLAPRGLSDFANGQDLMLHGLPWQVSLWTIINAKGGVMRDQLLQEGLITQNDVEVCQRAISSKKRFDHKFAVHKLDEPFPINFAKSLNLYIYCSEARLYCPWKASFLFADNRRSVPGCNFMMPYSGAALARFELSTSDADSVCLRFLKFLEPVKCVIPGYDGHIPIPSEGHLFRRPTGRNKTVDTWSYSTLEKLGQALRPLVQEASPHRTSVA